MIRSSSLPLRSQQPIFLRSLGRIRRRRNRLLSLRASSDISALLDGFFIGLPDVSGGPIRISTYPRLTVSRGQLLSGSPGCGTAVYGASFIRQRRIVLESSLLGQPRFFRLILLHEIFHFVWARLGNEKRRQYGELLAREFAANAKGELGYSAHLKKDARPEPGTPAWRDYVCESFCDSAAFVFAGFQDHSAFSLASRWARRRRLWFAVTFAYECHC